MVLQDNTDSYGQSEIEQLKTELAGTSRTFLDNDPVGLPDAADKKNIQTMLRNHEKVHPGEVAAYVSAAKQDRETSNEYGLNQDALKGGAARRRVLTMPACVLHDIEESYPLMFKNRKHLAWFIKNFPGFRTSEKF